MKEGYIVYNLSTSLEHIEVFGIFRSLENAEKMLHKVLKARFGTMSENEQFIVTNDTGDSYQIIPFDIWHKSQEDKELKEYHRGILKEYYRNEKEVLKARQSAIEEK